MGGNIGILEEEGLGPGNKLKLLTSHLTSMVDGIPDGVRLYHSLLLGVSCFEPSTPALTVLVPGSSPSRRTVRGCPSKQGIRFGGFRVKPFALGFRV